MIKKLFIIIISITYLFSLKVVNVQPLFSSYADHFEIYLSASSSGKIIMTDKISYVMLNGIKGESVSIDKLNFDVQEFLSDFGAEVILVENIDGGKSFYARTHKIKKVKEVKGEKINLHIFVGKERVVVGSPIIYGSF